MVANFEDRSLSQLRALLATQTPLISAIAAERISYVLILRDPFNNLASKRQANPDRDLNLVQQEMDQWKELAREYLGETRILPHKVLVNYNQWFASASYRKAVSTALELDKPATSAAAQRAIQQVPGVGQSQFDGRDYHGRAQQMSVFDRWRARLEDPVFMEAVRDRELWELSEQIFDLKRMNVFPATGEFFLLAERKISDKVRAVISPAVEVHDGVFTKPSLDALYSVDRLLVVNTYSKDFTTSDYWQGASSRHSFSVDLTRLRGMVFLFNFIVSPSIKLPSLARGVSDIRIITANRKFFDEIDAQDRYSAVRHYPRLQLESPIDLRTISTAKSPADMVRFGMHSKSLGNKWNVEIKDLIQQVNMRSQSPVAWDFMGMPSSVAEIIRDNSNVTIRQEFSLPVREYLTGIDVFVYFQSWKREEAWSRSAAEALASGAPVLATARGGNQDQFVDGRNGYLCRSTDDFIKYCLLLTERPDIRRHLRENAIADAQHFSSEQVIKRFLEFIQ